MTPRPGRAARRRARRPPAPLAQQDGLDPVRWAVPVGTAPGPVDALLLARFPALGDPGATPLSARLAAGDIVDADGRPLGPGAVLAPGDVLWFHREHRAEDVPDLPLPLLVHDEHLLVLDKPPGVATMPRGAHVLASALVRLRRSTGLGTLSPVHRLDRRTRGVLVFSVRPEERAAYQGLFARGEVAKEYRARVGPGGDLPTRVGEGAELRDRLERTRGDLRTRVVPGEANARTAVEVLSVAPDGSRLLALRPRTGRTHQLRVQLAARGAPILGEDLYAAGGGGDGPPRADPDGDLQLLALSLAFTDPLTGRPRELRSRRWLEGP